MEYGILSIIPPLLAIVLAFVLKDVLIALFAGIVAAAVVVAGPDFLAKTASYFATAVSENGSLIAMLVFMGPLMAFIQKSGGFQFFSNWAGKKIKNKKGSLLTTWLVSTIGGIADVNVATYATGILMRPLNDKNKVSREKFGFVLSSSGAIVQCLWPLNIWAIFFGAIITQATGEDGAMVYFKTIPFQFVGWASLIGCLLWALGVLPDFRKMRAAEKRAEELGQLYRPGSTPLTAEEIEEIVPTEKAKGDPLTLILPYGVALGCAVVTIIMGQLDLNMSFLLGLLVAIIYPLCRGYIKTKDISSTMYAGFKGMAVALLILIFACAISVAIKDVDFAGYIVNLTSGFLSGRIVPFIALLIAALTAFATGSSAGTVAVIGPLALSLAVGLGGNIVFTAAGILAGAMWGDTTSPISDLAVKPAMGAGADIMDMVSCQTPYKLCFLGVAALGFLVLAFI